MLAFDVNTDVVSAIVTLLSDEAQLIKKLIVPAATVPSDPAQLKMKELYLQ